MRRSGTAAVLVALLVVLGAAAAPASAVTIADLSTSLTDAPDPVAAGDTIAYDITVHNAGPNAAGSVSLSDGLPPFTTFVSLSSPGGWSCTTPAVGAGGTVTCSIALLPVGDSAFTLTVRTDAATADGTVLGNTATAFSTTFDSNPGDESATTFTTVEQPADLVTTIAAAPDPVAVGDDLTYTVSLAQNGPGDAPGAAMTLALPAQAAFRSLTPSGGWSCTTPAVDATGGTATCTFATALPAGAGGGFTLVVRPVAHPPGDALALTATASSGAADPTPADATATLATGVVPAPQPVGPSLNPPTVLSVSPTSGRAGSAVTIAGSGFAETSQVLFGDTPAASFTVDGYERITAVVPAGLRGAVDVRVVNPLGVSPAVAGDRFTAVADEELPRVPGSKPVRTRPRSCRMPRLVGRTLRGARRALRHRGCRVRLRHAGHARHHRRARVRAQRPAPGTRVRAGARVTVRLG